MYMKVKHIIAIFIFGYILEALGVHFKIMHLMGAPQLFTAGMIIKVLAAFLGIWKLLSAKSFQDFLNA